MKTIFLVTPEMFDLVMRIETLLLSLPKEGGILFTGASIIEGPGLRWEMQVVVGCARNLEVGTVEALVWAVVSKDPHLLEVRDRVKVLVYRGVARSLREGVDTGT